MTKLTRIYLDHAATSWPKSEGVLSAMDRFARCDGAAAGRGTYRSAERSDDVVALCRRRIARFINADHPSSISFHASGTAALNSAIHGLLRPGDHVVTTAAEHNSVLRPLAWQHQSGQIELTIVPCDELGFVDANQVLDAIRQNTRLVAVTHASNVTGAVQPIADIGRAIRQEDAILLCDAAQTFGYLPIDVNKLGIDVLASPGHKGGGAPLGTAFLYCDPRCDDELQPTIQGGTGTLSDSLDMPDSMPEKLEAGNLNVPALAAWSVAMEELMSIGIDNVSDRCRLLAAKFKKALESISSVRILGPLDELPIASITMDGVSPSDLAVILDVEFHIEARSGFHCAAEIHRFLGTTTEGTLRLSAGRTTSDREVDLAIDALGILAQTFEASARAS